MLHVKNVHIILDWHASMDQWPLKLENLHLYAVYPQSGQFNQLKHIIVYMRTYFEGWETKVPGDWRQNVMDISRHETIVVPTCLYMVMGFCASQYGRVALC